MSGEMYQKGELQTSLLKLYMNAERLGMIFEVGLLPFVRDHFPDGHRLQQDNDPKHASGRFL